MYSVGAVRVGARRRERRPQPAPMVRAGFVGVRAVQGRPAADAGRAHSSLAAAAEVLDKRVLQRVEQALLGLRRALARRRQRRLRRRRRLAVPPRVLRTWRSGAGGWRGSAACTAPASISTPAPARLTPAPHTALSCSYRGRATRCHSPGRPGPGCAPAPRLPLPQARLPPRSPAAPQPGRRAPTHRNQPGQPALALLQGARRVGRLARARLAQLLQLAQPGLDLGNLRLHRLHVLPTRMRVRNGGAHTEAGAARPAGPGSPPALLSRQALHPQPRAQ